MRVRRIKPGRFFDIYLALVVLILIGTVSFGVRWAYLERKNCKTWAVETRKVTLCESLEVGDVTVPLCREETQDYAVCTEKFAEAKE